jgi:hypothetical protein
VQQAIIETLQGYARANLWLETERMERLARMTPDEARAIFQELNASWEAMFELEEGLERLDLWRIETLVGVRHALKQLAEAKGWI